MSGPKRIAAILMAIFVGAAALVAGSATASAAPYPNPPRIVCVVHLVPRFVVKCHLSSYLPDHDIKVVLHSTPVTLGTIKVDGTGSGDVSHQVSSSFYGLHTVIGTDTTVATDVASTQVRFPAQTGGSGAGGLNSGSTSGSGTGGLSSTGVAVLSIGGFGLLLLAAGSVFVFSGRRRRSLA